MIDFKIGKPYSFRDYHCWIYVKDIREQAGINTKDFIVKNLSDAFNTITSEMSKIDHGLSKVDSHQDFDVVIGSKTKGSSKVYHCGVYHNGRVFHCDRALGQVVHQSYNSFIKSFEGVTLWR